jgi:predicted amidohydrolase YtcJ
MSWIDLDSAKAATPTRVAHAQPRPDWARHEGVLAGTSPSDPHRPARRCATANRCARSLVAGLTIWMGLGGASWASEADLVVVGPVVTMAASRPHARGLAVAGGKIVFVGDAASARKLLRSGGRLIALEPGQVVIPGLVDAHNHMMDAGLMRQRCALDMPGGACGGAKNKVDALKMIAKYSKEHPDLPGKWVIGSGWSGDWDWDNRQLGPSAAELDTVVADRPAVFYDDNGHSAWLNSLALKEAGITACEPVPRGRIECKDEKPWGTLREAAQDRVEKVVPKPTKEQWLAGLLEAQTYLHSLGITMLQDANVNPGMVEAYSEAAKNRRLTMKVVAAQLADPGTGKTPEALADELAKQRNTYSVGRFSASAAKIFIDGILEPQTAALLAPYLGGNESGILNWKSEDLAKLVSRLDRHGMQVHMHAIGDRAVREALDAVAVARSANGPSDNRHHIAHVQLVAPADLPRFRALGVIANVQPFWMFPDKWIERNAAAVIGPERARQLYPLRSIVRTGARIAGGSDWFVSSPNPFLAIQVGMTRQDPAAPVGAPWIPAERVSRQVLLAAYTLGGAHLNHRENETGSLEVGKAADFVIVDRNPLTVPVREIGGTRVLNTFVDGEEVYAAKRATGATSRSRPEEGRPQGEGRVRR